MCVQRGRHRSPLDPGLGAGGGLASLGPSREARKGAWSRPLHKGPHPGAGPSSWGQLGTTGWEHRDRQSCTAVPSSLQASSSEVGERQPRGERRDRLAWEQDGAAVDGAWWRGCGPWSPGPDPPTPRPAPVASLSLRGQQRGNKCTPFSVMLGCARAVGATQGIWPLPASRPQGPRLPPVGTEAPEWEQRTLVRPLHALTPKEPLRDPRDISSFQERRAQGRLGRKLPMGGSRAQHSHSRKAECL